MLLLVGGSITETCCLLYTSRQLVPASISIVLRVCPRDHNRKAPYSVKSFVPRPLQVSALQAEISEFSCSPGSNGRLKFCQSPRGWSACLTIAKVYQGGNLLHVSILGCSNGIAAILHHVIYATTMRVSLPLKIDLLGHWLIQSSMLSHS